MAERVFEGHDLKSYGAIRKKTPLAELLPLESPLVVMIDPSNACTFKCVFCPTGNDQLLEKVGRPKGKMEMSLFKKIIDEMSGFRQKPKALHLLKDGEPLLNTNIIEMVAYAKQANVVESIEMTSNGSLLNQKNADGLIDAGLDVIRISVEATDSEGYKKITQNFGRFDKILQNVEYFYKQKTLKRPEMHVHCKVVDTGLTHEQKMKFCSDFGPISDSINLDAITGWSSEFDLGSPVKVSQETGSYGVDPVKPDRIACPEPFMKLAVNFNGQVSPCCADWSMQAIVGDCNTTNIVDIWKSSTLREFQLAHLQGNRKSLKACENCTFYQGIPPVKDIDNVIETILPFYQATN